MFITSTIVLRHYGYYIMSTYSNTMIIGSIYVVSFLSSLTETPQNSYLSTMRSDKRCVFKYVHITMCSAMQWLESKIIFIEILFMYYR